MAIRIEKLQDKNFLDYESITCRQSHGGCYCSFWHQKWQSMTDWEKCQKETPERNRQLMLEKMRSGFHLGVLVYENSELIAWVSVAPIIEFYWTWKRVAQLGESAKSVAGITCFTIVEKFRGQGKQVEILEALKIYGREQKWKSIESYPFEQSALEKLKNDVIWPGILSAYAKAGFVKIAPHWMSAAEAQRSIYHFQL